MSTRYCTVHDTWVQKAVHIFDFVLTPPPPGRPPNTHTQTGPSSGVRARVRALGANPDEHVRRVGLLDFLERGPHHELVSAVWVFTLATRKGFDGAGGVVRGADTPWVVEGRSPCIVELYCSVFLHLFFMFDGCRGYEV